MAASNPTLPNFHTDVLCVWDFAGTPSANNTLTFPNGAVIGSSVFTDIIPKSTIPFDEGGDAVTLSVDNPTPLLLYFPLDNIYVGPWQQSVVVQLQVQQRQVWVQGIATTNFAGVSTFPLSVRYSKDASIPTPGASSILFPNVNITDGQSQIYTADTISFTPGATPNPLFVLGGYDIANADSNLFSLARTANQWISAYAVLPAVNNATILSYTSPAGVTWRLLALRVMVENSGLALSSGRLLWRVLEGATVRLDYQAMEVFTYQARAIVNFPGNGLRALTSGSTLNVQVFSDSAQGLARVSTDLYIGP